MTEPSPDDYVTRVEYVQDRARLQAFVARGEVLFGRLEQILEERSGTRREIEQMQRDIQASHDKHRKHYKDHAVINRRLERLDSRQSRLWYGLLGAFVLVEALVRLIPDSAIERLFS